MHTLEDISRWFWQVADAGLLLPWGPGVSSLKTYHVHKQVAGGTLLVLALFLGVHETVTVSVVSLGIEHSRDGDAITPRNG